MPNADLNITIKATDQTGSAFQTVHKRLDDIKRSLGSRGPLKDFSEVLVGGGAVAGLTFTARVLGDAAEKAVRIRDEFNAGKISTGEMVDQMIRAVPVLGQIYTAGRQINELLTGTEARWRQINEESAKFDATMKAHVQTVRAGEESYKRLADIIADLQRQGGNALLTGPELDAALLKQAQDDRRKAIEESVRKEREQFEGRIDPKTDKGEKLAALEKTLRDAEDKVAQLEGRIARSKTRVHGFGAEVAAENDKRIQDDINIFWLQKDLESARAERDRAKVPVSDIQKNLQRIGAQRAEAIGKLGTTEANERTAAAIKRAGAALDDFFRSVEYGAEQTLENIDATLEGFFNGVEVKAERTAEQAARIDERLADFFGFEQSDRYDPERLRRRSAELIAGAGVSLPSASAVAVTGRGMLGLAQSAREGEDVMAPVVAELKKARDEAAKDRERLRRSFADLGRALREGQVKSFDLSGRA